MKAAIGTEYQEHQEVEQDKHSQSLCWGRQNLARDNEIVQQPMGKIQNAKVK